MLNPKIEATKQLNEKEPPVPGVDEAFPQIVGQQRAVIELLAEGCDPKETAARLGISRRTVEIHRRLAFAKLGTNKASAAVSIFLRTKMQLLEEENRWLRQELARREQAMSLPDFVAICSVSRSDKT